MSHAVVSLNELVGCLGKTQDDHFGGDVSLRLGVSRRRVVDELTYLDYEKEGVQFIFNKFGELQSVFLFAKGYEGHLPFKGDLPSSIVFGEMPEDVRIKLGEPIQSGGGMVGMLGRKIHLWEKFDHGQYQLTVQYGDEGVQLVTLISSEGLKL